MDFYRLTAAVKRMDCIFTAMGGLVGLDMVRRSMPWLRSAGLDHGCSHEDHAVRVILSRKKPHLPKQPIGERLLEFNARPLSL
jgi:hypothetical protein